MEYNVCGVILSGGESRRFGAHKAFALYKGVSFWEHSFNALEGVTDTQIIVSHPALVERFKTITNLSVIEDDQRMQGNGPMAGIYSAMNQVNAKWYVVLSCDIPAIQKQVITELLALMSDTVEAIIPVIEGRFQPLVGLYHHSTFPKIKELLHNGNYRLMSLLEQINVQYVNENDLNVDPKVFRNINDLDAFTELTHDEKSFE